MNEEKYIQLLEDGELFGYINELQQRIDKAMEYIYIHSRHVHKNLYLWELKELLEILRGDVSNE